MEYITADELINSVLNQLKSYADSGVLDKSIFYDEIRYINRSLGLKLNKTESILLDVLNNNTDLPANFQKLIFAHGCYSYDVTTPVLNNQGHLLREEIIEAEYICPGQCNLCLDDCGNQIVIKEVTNEFKTHRYFETFPVCLKSTKKEYCEPECPNLEFKCPNEIIIKNGQILTNFKEGKLYIDYVTKLEDEDGNLLVPDDERLLKYYRAVLIYEGFKYLYNNGYADVAQRLQLAQAEKIDTEGRAKSIVRSSEFKDYLKLGIALRKRYQPFVDMLFPNKYSNARYKTDTNGYTNLKLR